MSLRISSKGPILKKQAISECTINLLQQTLLQEKKGSQEDSDPQKGCSKNSRRFGRYPENLLIIGQKLKLLFLFSSQALEDPGIYFSDVPTIVLVSY